MAIVGIHMCLFIVCCCVCVSVGGGVAETSCRRNVLSPKRRIAESASPKLPVAETLLAESSCQTIILSPNRPIAESSSPKRPSPNRRRRNVLDRAFSPPWWPFFQRCTLLRAQLRETRDILMQKGKGHNKGTRGSEKSRNW